MNVSNILKALKIHQNYAGTMAICSYVVQCGKLHARPVASSLSPWQRISSADCGTAQKPRSSLQWSHSLVLSSLVGFLSLCSRGQRTRKPQVWLASSRTKLLVDGDCHSIDGIRLAIRCLEEHCGETVHTTLFAPPKRLLSKKWRKFIEEDGMSFQPIHRASIDLSAEPNDQALAEAMRQLFKLQVSVALLTEDSDFIEPIVDLEEIGANITVLLPENLYGLIHRYKRHGVKVLEVPLPRKPPGTRVRALLHQDGGGSVKLADPYQTPASEHFASVQNEVANLLQALGYGDVRQGYLVNVVQMCTKFWFENQLGALTVFPHFCPATAVHRVLTECEAPGNWEGYSGKLAYFLPITSRGDRLSKKKERIYGYVRARGVFRGGGPFMLEDSPSLVVRALRQLGFLYDDFNSDVSEAMFLFINSAENKKPLRKSGMLPCPGDSPLDVDSKLRSAFLSHATPDTWQVKSPTAVKPVVQILKKERILSADIDSECEYSIEEIFEAMKSYAKQQQLPVMQTFNGLVWSIVRQNNMSPTRRQVVDFDR